MARWPLILLLVAGGLLVTGGGVVASSVLIDELHRRNTHVPNPLDKYLYFLYTPNKQRTLLRLFFRLVTLLQKYKIQYWAICGTLLGHHRHGGFIPHDDDIDISIHQCDLPQLQKICGDQLKQHNDFIWKFRDNSHPSDIFIDIFPVRSTTIQSRPALEFIGRGARLFPQFYLFVDDLFPLKKGQFCSFTIWIPKNTTKWLKQMYGANCLKTLVISHVHHRFRYASIIRLWFTPKWRKSVKLTPKVQQIIAQLNGALTHLDEA